MREFLTFFGLVLVLLLCAALIGPQFVNWDGERDVLAMHLSQWLGRPVQISGPISLRLLPAPKLRLGALEVEGTAAQSHFAARDVKLDLAVMPLLQGKFELTTAAFNHAQLTLVQHTSGGFDLPLPQSTHFQGVALAALRLRDGTVSFVRQNGAPLLTLAKLNLDAAAQSLAGPLHATGTFASPQGALPFSLDMGMLKDHEVPLAWSTEALGSWPHAHFAGKVAWGVGSPEASGALQLHGSLRATPGSVVLPWVATMAVRADLAHMTVQKLDLTLGSGAAALHANGAAAMSFAPQPRATLSLHARQIDLDQMIAAGPTKPDGALGVVTFDPEMWLSAPSGALPFTLTVEATTPIINWGADGVRNVSVRLGLTPAGPVKVDLEGLAPAGTHLNLNGTVERGAAADFKGVLAAHTDDAPALARWLHQLHLPLATTLADRLKALPFLQVGWQGPLDVSRVSFASQKAVVRLDRTTLTGALAYTADDGRKPARLFADLDAPTLDIDHVPDGSVMSDTALDLDLALRAHAVRVAHFGGGMIDAGHVDFHVTRSKGRLDLTDLKVTNLGGATITASGVMGADGGALQADISASRLVEASDLLARLFPGAWTAALQARAPFLAPAKLHLAARSRAASTETSKLPMFAEISGTMAATDITGTMTPSPKGLNAHIVLKAPDGAAFLRQLGFATLPLQGLGGADVVLDLGEKAGRYQLGAQGAVAGTSFASTTTLRPRAQGLDAEGSFHLESPDVLALSRMLALALPVTSAQLPLHMKAAFKGDEAGFGISGIKGVADGDAFSGTLHWQPAKATAAVLSGSLDVAWLDFPSLGALVLGVEPPGANMLTSRRAFGSGFDRLDIAQLHLKTAQFRLGIGNPEPGPASFDLGLQHHTLAIDKFQGALAGGHLSGKLTLSRHGAQAAMAGAARFSGANIDAPSLKAQADGTISVAATGTSPAGLLEALAGEGAFSLHQTKVPRANPLALAATLQALGDGEEHFGATHVGALLQGALDKASLNLGEQKLIATLSGGVLDMRPATPGGHLHLTLDLKHGSLKQSLELPPAPTPPLWSGAPPHIGLSFSGPLAHPQREINMGSLLDGLATRAIALQRAKIAAFKADVQERAMFIRRLHGWRTLERNAADENKFEAQRAAAAAAAQKAKDDASAQKALLAAKKIMAAPSPPAAAPIVIKPLAPLHFQTAPEPAAPPLMLVPPPGVAPAH